MALPKLQYGDLLAFRPTGKVGELIRVIDSKGEGQYSHWAIYLGNFLGLNFFIESHEAKKGVVIVVLREWIQTYDIYRAKDLEPRPMKELLNMQGKKYGYGRIVDLLLHKLFKKKLQAKSPDQPICTELCNYTFRYELVKAGYATPFSLEKCDKLELIYSSKN